MAKVQRKDSAPMCEQKERDCWDGANTEEMQQLGSDPQPHQVTACCRQMASGETDYLRGQTWVMHVLLKLGACLSGDRQKDQRQQFIPLMFFHCLIGRPEIRPVPVISLRMQILICCLLNA